jgi:aldehyde dehydrogenase family 7 protein A1
MLVLRRAAATTRVASVAAARTMASGAGAPSLRNTADVLNALGMVKGGVVEGVFDGVKWGGSGPLHSALNPSTGEVLAQVRLGSAADYERCVANAKAAQEAWQLTPAPKRGDIVRQIGNALRAKKEALGALLSLEMGKIRSEGQGEVQEYIDVCDLAAGLGRQLPGQVLPSERADHAMLEAWHPLGLVGIITAFNFPHAVCGWNSAIALTCGNVQLLKGAESASLVSVATQQVITEVLRANNVNPAVAVLCQGTGKEVGELMLADERVDLVSFTGSTKVGQRVNEVVGRRFGRPLLELGGNNAIVVMPSADLDMALRTVLFAAAGTCGQRCTSLRRLLLHEEVHDSVLERLVAAYQSLPYGDPLDPATLVGPLHNAAGVELFERTVREAVAQGGRLLAGGIKVPTAQLPKHCANGNFVKPAIVAIDADAPIVQEERFVPVLYVCKTPSLDAAIKTNNQVKQGLSSALFSRDMREVFKWSMGPRGSDTGIVNVNTSCSGAEIGGAFGGNKHTGGGRESGSDSWKQYMRRTTICINFSDKLPLAQGIEF